MLAEITREAVNCYHSTVARQHNSGYADESERVSGSPQSLHLPARCEHCRPGQMRPQPVERLELGATESFRASSHHELNEGDDASVALDTHGRDVPGTATLSEVRRPLMRS